MSTNGKSDVLIIGEGIAGCCAAIAAHGAGAGVQIIDKAPADVPHGNTAFSGGAFRRVGPEYSAERYYDDLIALSGGRADPELAHILVDASTEAQDWLESLGVRWQEAKRRATETAQSEDRGRGLAAAIRRAVVDRGIPVRHRTQATAFIQEGGTIAGVKARDADDNETEFHAGAVILAAGGFSANIEMITHYIGAGALNMVRRGSPYNTGDGLRMAEAVGARLDWMEDFHGGIIHYGYKAHPEYGAVAGMRHIIGYETGLIVNRDGQRFVDEGENISEKTYAKFGKIIPLKQPGGFAFVVYDAQSRDAVDPLYAGPEAEPVEAPSIAALADAIGVPRQALIDTVTSFNAGVRDGKSLTVSPPKSNYARRLEVPPFFAHKVTGGFTFTFGGLRTRANGEVLGTDGRWIAGLFATGEITTGLFYGNYGGGSSLPKCAIFGRLAGAAAAGYAKRAARQ